MDTETDFFRNISELRLFSNKLNTNTCGRRVIGETAKPWRSRQSRTWADQFQ